MLQDHDKFCQPLLAKIFKFIYNIQFMKLIVIILSFTLSILSAGELTIASYNCGGLTEHYDYLRACAMQKVMEERYKEEPENMAYNEKVQRLALKRLFTKGKQLYDPVFENLTSSPMAPGSINAIWYEKANQMISSYKIRPVNIADDEVLEMLNEHMGQANLTEVRAKMAKSIFNHHLKFDIICLQEADYLDASLFPTHMQLLISNSKNGVAWNKERFQLIEAIEMDKAYGVLLQDNASGKKILVASGHISGCNPFRIENGDSQKGDQEIQNLLALFEKKKADLKIIGMDSNVTALHPRLKILKNAGYKLDYENFLEPTCASPYQVLNTRIDWIFLKGNHASITNIPVLSVGLNNMITNISDHKPIAAKVTF